MKFIGPGCSRMLKKSASFVLASLRGSPYRSVRLTSSFAAASLDGHFEHPASRSSANTMLSHCARSLYARYEIRDTLHEERILGLGCDEPS